MALSAQNPSDRAAQLLALTNRLAQRLADETVMLEAHRPQDLFNGIEETRMLSNLYRHETTRIKADPSLLAGITQAEKVALLEATQAFHDNLARYDRAVTAAKTITEGILTAVAEDMHSRKATTTIYGAQGRTRNSEPQSLNYSHNA